MKKIVLFLICFVCSVASIAHGAELTTIYLVRHGEKVDSSSTSDLTELGKQRADSFARMLQDHEVNHVFSTPYLRTRNTAAPTASYHGLNITEYDPSNGEALVELLRTLAGTIFVTGHSNTIPGLVNLLTGENFDDLDERVFDKVYVVTLADGSYSKLEIFHSRPRTPINAI